MGESGRQCLSLLRCCFLTQQLNSQCHPSGLWPSVQQSPGFITAQMPQDPWMPGHCCHARTAWARATSHAAGAVACWKSRWFRMVYGPHVQGCVYLFICCEPLLANTSVEGAVGGWDDAGQRMLLCDRVLLPQLEKESEGSCQQQTHFSSARTCQWHGIMEVVCWKLKGFSRTFVNDIKERLVEWY